MTASSPNELEHSSYELFILALSTLSLLNILFIILAPAQETRSVIATFDFFLCFVFIGDFFFRLAKAPSKSAYLLKEYGWLDFLGSLPINGLRIARIFRIARVIRLLRKFGIKNMIRQFSRRRAGSTLLTVLFFIILALEFASAFILQVESTALSANILTPSDALWWTFVTITTVGYGDHYPVTAVGRVIGLILMTAGIGLFGVLTGYLANAFLSPEKESLSEHSIAGPADLQQKLGEIKTLLDKQNKANLVLKERIKEIEKLL